MGLLTIWLFVFQVNTSFQSYKQDSIAYIHAKGDKDALHYLITTIGKVEQKLGKNEQNMSLLSELAFSFVNIQSKPYCT